MVKTEVSEYRTFRTLPFRLPTISDKLEVALIIQGILVGGCITSQLGKGKNTLTKSAADYGERRERYHIKCAWHE